MEYRLQISGRFCSLEDKEFVFSIGANFLFGRNGSGKTSLLRAVMFSLFDRAVGDRGNQANRPEGQYILKLANGIFEIESGRTAKEGLIYRGICNGTRMNGERAENYQKFLGWLDIKPGQAFSTILERIQFDPASPSIFTLSQSKVIESVTSALSERTRQYQSCYNRLMEKRNKIKDELDRAKERSQDISGSEFVSTEQIDEEIKLEYAKINGRPEPFKLDHFKQILVDLQNELKVTKQEFKKNIITANEHRQILQSRIENIDFDEEQIKKEHDENLVEVATLSGEISRLRANVLKPKPCGNCRTPLLEGKDEYIVADTQSIKKAENEITTKENIYNKKKIRQEELYRLSIIAQSKNQLSELETRLADIVRGYKTKVAKLNRQIEYTKLEIKNCQTAEPFWKRLTELQQRLAIIKDNNERLEKLKAQAEIIDELEKKFRLYDFHRTAGIRDLLFSHFTNQCSRFSSTVNEVLYACDLGKIEFIPEFGRDNNIEKIRIRHFEKGAWRPYAEREDSLKKILDWAGWISNIKLNPQKVDSLKLMLIDDLGNIFDERLERFLDYMRQQPVVMLFAWAFRDCEKYLKPVQTIVLGE